MLSVSQLVQNSGVVVTASGIAPAFLTFLTESPSSAALRSLLNNDPTVKDKPEQLVTNLKTFDETKI